MSDIQLMQEQYEIGNDRAVVDAATEDGLISLAFTFDKIAKGLEALSVHISPKNEAIDPENYSALREIVELDLDSANRDLAEKGIEIKISPDKFDRARRWNNGAVATKELEVIKQRIIALNAGKNYTVTFGENGENGEGYFTDNRDISEHLAHMYGLARAESHLEKNIGGKSATGTGREID